MTDRAVLTSPHKLKTLSDLYHGLSALLISDSDVELVEHGPRFLDMAFRNGLFHPERIRNGDGLVCQGNKPSSLFLPAGTKYTRNPIFHGVEGELALVAMGMAKSISASSS